MYTPKEFAKKIGVSVSTLRRWDKEKRLVPLRTKTNHRVYLENTKSKSNRWLKKIHDIRTHDRTCSQ